MDDSYAAYMRSLNRQVNSNINNPNPFAYRAPPVAPTKKRKSRFFRRYIRPLGKATRFIGKGIRTIKKDPKRFAQLSLYIYQLLDALARDGPNSARFVDLMAKGFTGKYKKDPLELEYVMSKLPKQVVENTHVARYVGKERSRIARRGGLETWRDIAMEDVDPLEFKEPLDSGVGVVAPLRAKLGFKRLPRVSVPTETVSGPGLGMKRPVWDDGLSDVELDDEEFDPLLEQPGHKRFKR